jgi:hypothetical protein
MNKQINRERRDKIETNRITQKQNNTKAEHVREKESDRERRSTACEGEGSQRRRAAVRVVVSRLEFVVVFRPNLVTATAETVAA